MCSALFANGDRFIGSYKDGRPNGPGEMFYKNSLKIASSGTQNESAKYVGNFRHGKRDGFGIMIWGDGTTFRGHWAHDLRHRGQLLMANNAVYQGSFVNDCIEGPNELLLTPGMPIYEGAFIKAKTQPFGLLLFNNGSIYLGQHEQLNRIGKGKCIELDGSYQEGDWT